MPTLTRFFGRNGAKAPTELHDFECVTCQNFFLSGHSLQVRKGVVQELVDSAAPANPIWGLHRSYIVSGTPFWVYTLGTLVRSTRTGAQVTIKTLASSNKGVGFVEFNGSIYILPANTTDKVQKSDGTLAGTVDHPDVDTPFASFGIVHNKRLVLNDLTNLSRIWLSDTNAPDVFRNQETSTVETEGGWINVSVGDGDRIKALAQLGSAAFIFKERSIHMLVGSSFTGDEEFRLIELFRGIGTKSPRSVKQFENGLMFIDSDGLIRFFYGPARRLLSAVGRPLEDLTTATPATVLEEASAFVYDRKYFLSFAAAADAPPTFTADGIVWRKGAGLDETSFTADSGATWAGSTGEGGAYLGQGKDSGAVWCGDAADVKKLAKSTDKGATFALIGGAVHAVRGVQRTLVQLSGGRIIVGLTNAHAAPNDTLAIAYSDDNATTWTTVVVDATLASTSVNLIRPHSLWAVNATTLLFIARLNDGADREQLFRSTDSGLTWAKVGPVFTFASGGGAVFLWVDPKTGYIFANRSGPGEVLRSTDLGATFQTVATGVDGGDVNFPTRSRIARNALDELLFIWGSSPAGARKSTDNGASWVAYTTGPPIVLGDGGGLYRMKDALIQSKSQAGAADPGYRSTDNGLTWTSMGSGMGGEYVDFTSPTQEPTVPGAVLNTESWALDGRLISPFLEADQEADMPSGWSEITGWEWNVGLVTDGQSDSALPYFGDSNATGKIWKFLSGTQDNDTAIAAAWKSKAYGADVPDVLKSVSKVVTLTRTVSAAVTHQVFADLATTATVTKAITPSSTTHSVNIWKPAATARGTVLQTGLTLSTIVGGEILSFDWLWHPKRGEKVDA